MSIGGLILIGVVIGYLGINSIVEGVKDLFSNNDGKKND